MERKSISGRSLNEAITSDDFLGKEVIDKAGGFVGIVEAIYIDSKTLKFLGIGIDRGVLNKGLNIGKGYIQKVTKHTIFLKEKIAFDIKGLKVYNKKGKYLGKVVSVEMKGTRNKVKSFKVKKGFKTMEFSGDKIERIGGSVIVT